MFGHSGWDAEEEDLFDQELLSDKEGGGGECPAIIFSLVSNMYFMASIL